MLTPGQAMRAARAAHPTDPARKARTLEAAARLDAPTRGDVGRRRALTLAIAVVGMATVLLLWGGPAHLAGRPESVDAWIVVGLAALAIAVTLVVLPRRGMLAPPATRLAMVVVAVPVVVAAWLMAWHSVYEDPFTRLGFRCFALTVASAPWPFLALLSFAPRFELASPRLTGAALGAAAGAWAAVLVELWCPLADSAHVLAGHALPLVFLAGVGALVGKKRLKLRA